MLTDKSNPKANLLIERIKELTEGFAFASIHDHHCEEEDCSIQGAGCIDLGYTDLTHAETITDEDSLETMLKKEYEVPKIAGEERVADYGQFWDKLNDVVEEFAAQNSQEK